MTLMTLITLSSVRWQSDDLLIKRRDQASALLPPLFVFSGGH